MLGYKPWLRGDFGYSQLAWINRVRDVYNNTWQIWNAPITSYLT